VDKQLVAAARRYSIGLAALIGVVLVVVAAAIKPTSFVGALCISVGGALIAASVFAFFALGKDEFIERLWDLGVADVFKNRKKDLPDDFWVKLITDARHHYRAVGPAHHGYIGDAPSRRKFTEAFRQAVIDHRVEVEFLWLDPLSDLAAVKEAEEAPRTTRHDAVESMEFFWAFREGLEDALKEKVSLRTFKKYPTCGIVWSDGQVLITNYMPFTPDLFSPGLLLHKRQLRFRRLRGFVHVPTRSTEEQLVDVYTGLYEGLKATGNAISRERLDEFIEAKKGFPHTPSEADLRRGSGP